MKDEFDNAVFQADFQARAFASVKGYFADFMIARARERAAVEQLKAAIELRKSTEEAFKTAMVATVGSDLKDEARALLDEALPETAAPTSDKGCN